MLTVIALLLGTASASRAGWFSLGYAAGLGLVFALGALGFAHLGFPRIGVNAAALLVAGLVLVVAGGLRFVRYRRPRSLTRSSIAGAPARRSSVFRRAAERMRGGAAGSGRATRVVSALLGAQFAVHPENLILTLAASSRAAEVDPVSRVLVGLWFCLLGVSTVALPTMLVARSGERGRAVLRRVHGAIARNSFLLSEVAIGAIGAALVLVAAVQLARLA